MKILTFFIFFISINLFSQSLEKGISLYQSRNYKQAITELKRVVDNDPNNFKAHYYLGMCFIVLEDSEKAIDYLTKSIQANNKFPDAYNSRGLAYGYIGEVENSMSDFDRALILDPEFAEAYLNRATAHTDLGNVQQAVDDFSMAISLSPQNPSTYYQRGQLYIKLKNFDNAIKDIQHAIDMGFKRSDIYFELGNCYFLSERWRQAIDIYTEAIRLNPRNHKALNNRAVSYDKIGKKAEAEKDRKTLEKMAGVRFTPFDKIKWKTFKSSDGSISIELPSDWYLYEVEKNTDRTEIMISPQKWDEKSASIMTSANLAMNRNMNAIFQVSGAHNLVEFWSNSNAKNSEDYLDYKVGSQKITELDGLYARIYRTYRQVDDNSIAFESFEIAAASDDELFYGYMQSPHNQWQYYEPIFEKAIKTLKFQ